MATAALETVDQLVAVGADPAATIRCFCNALAEAPPEIEDAPLEEGFAYLWARKLRRLQRVRVEGPKQAHRRHIRKYAEGELRVPTMSAMHSNLKPATCSNLKPASVPI